MNNYKVNNLHINGKVASGIVKGLWYRVTFDFIPTKERLKGGYYVKWNVFKL